MASLGIEVAGVAKRLRATRALVDVTTRFAPGTLNGLIGPDGAGKTTLIRTLIGLLKADAGTVTYTSDGAPVPFARVRPFMAYQPQQQSLYPDLSVGEHLDFFAELYRIPRDVYGPRREELLGITRLAPFTDRPAGALSGGMYKKLGLMCALLQSPNAVLLDEPTNGVDPISRREFWELLYRLVREGILVLVATSYMDEAERCGAVHLLDQGTIIAAGEPRAVLAGAGKRTFEEIFLAREGAPA